MAATNRTETAARPAAAVELTAEGVLAAALPSKGAAPVYAFAPLHAGALTPGSQEANLRGVEQVTAAIGAALGDAGTGAAIGASATLLRRSEGVSTPAGTVLQFVTAAPTTL